MSQTNHLSLAVLTLFLGGAVAAQEKALPQTAKLLPPETALLVEVADFNALQKQFAKTSTYKFYTDPLMAPFVEDFKTKWPDKLRILVPQLGDAIGSIDAPPHGRVAFAMVLNEQTKDANELPFLVITEWGDRIPDIKEAVDKMVEKAVNEGSHRKTEDYRGAGIITITSDGSEQVSYTFIDDCLVTSADPASLKFVVAHLKGAESPTLAEDADYISSLKATGPYHDIDCYVNVKHIVKIALADGKDDKARTIIANLGLENVTSVRISSAVGREPGQPLSGKVLIKINGSKRGVFKMLDMESAALKIPRFVPASACAAMILNLDIKKAYEELANILASFSPQAGAMMAMPLIPPSPDGEPGLQLKRDIIDHAGAQILVVQSIEKKVTENAPPTETVIAIAVGNRQAIEKSLATLHSKLLAMGRPDAQRELLGHTIYVVGPPGLPFLAPGKTPMQTQTPPGPMPLPSIAFTVTGTHLIFGSEAAVERAIRTLSSSEAATLDSAEWFALGKSAMPSNVGLASLQDNAAASEPAWELIRNIGTAAKAGPDPSMSRRMGPNSGLMFAQTGFGLFDFSLLPEFDKVRKYFGVSASHGVSRPDGFYFEFKHIDSAELK